MILSMTSQHRFTNRNYRPDDAEYEPAREAVEAAGFNMNLLVRALLREFNEKPDRRIRTLAKHLRAVADSTPRGRPKAAASGSERSS
jgi:hypothetical protein